MTDNKKRSLSLKRKGVHGKKSFKFGDKVMYYKTNRQDKTLIGYPRKAVCITDEQGGSVGLEIFHGCIYSEVVWSGNLKRGWKHDG